MFRPCHNEGCVTYFPSDGHVLELMDDFDLGVKVINPQFKANGIEGLVQKCKGRICVVLDRDEQLFPFATPKEIKNHVKRICGKTWLKERRTYVIYQMLIRCTLGQY